MSESIGLSRVVCDAELTFPCWPAPDRAYIGLKNNGFGDNPLELLRRGQPGSRPVKVTVELAEDVSERVDLSSQAVGELYDEVSRLTDENRQLRKLIATGSKVGM